MDLMADLLSRIDMGREDLRIDITKYDDSSLIFLDTLLDRAKRLDLVPENPVELVNGDVPDVDVDDLSPRGARELGLRINLLDFCKEGWHWLFDHLTGLPGKKFNNYWVIEGFHVLHQLEERSTGFETTINDWLETDLVQRGLRRLTDHNWNFKDKEHACSKQGLQAMSIWPTKHLTIGYQAAATCAGCWKFLQRIKDWGYEWIFTAGYDITGESWLSIAIEHDNQPLIEHLVQQLTKEQINDMRCIQWNWGHSGNTDRRDLGHYESKHPVIHLISRKNSRGLELVLDKLQDNLSSFDFLGTRRVKLELCRFASPALATRLLVNKDFDISDIKESSDTFVREEDRRERAFHDDRERAFNEDRYQAINDQKKIYHASMTTSWHEAARENPHGADFMEWLKVGTEKSEISKIRNADEETILEHAVRCGKLICVEWLCNNTDLMVMREWTRDDGTKVPIDQPGEALRLAAESMAPLSAIIFKTILREMPTSHTYDFEVAKQLFWRICCGYRDHISGESWPYGSLWNPYNFSDTSMEDAKWLAIKKCQILVSHLPSTWAGSNQQRFAVLSANNMLGCGFLTHHMRTPPPETRSQKSRGREHFFGLGQIS